MWNGLHGSDCTCIRCYNAALIALEMYTKHNYPKAHPITITGKSPSSSNRPKATHTRRAIIHIDIDCFFAQVELQSRPRLQNKPVCIQQHKDIICVNYPGNEHLYF